jgi:hypothetical protein
MYQHASYSYPSELVPLFELAFTLVALLLVAWRPPAFDRALRRSWRRLARLSPRAAALGVGAVLLVAALLILAILGPPVPRVSDEHGYLLLADTFAHGRLTNPQPKVPEAFEAFHIIVRPTYTSKFPPAQGALLAVGELVGSPAIGLVLGVALLGAATAWFLAGFVPRPWPLFGALFLGARVGLDSYWGHSYWGGLPQSIGGLLLFGALPRIARPGARIPWLAISGGLLILALSRPFEGFVVAIPAGVVGVVLFARRWRREGRAPRRVPALVAGLGAAAAVILVYQWKVTGDPLLMPYVLHNRAYGVQEIVPWLQTPTPAPSHPSTTVVAGLAMRRLHAITPASVAQVAFGYLARETWFLLGLPLLAFAVATCVRFNASRRLLGWKTFALGVPLLLALAHGASSGWFYHYAGPVAGLTLLLGLLGLREASALPWRGRRLGPWLPAAVLAVQLAVLVVELPAHRPDADDWGRERVALTKRIERGGRAVVFVDADIRMPEEWVYNGADLDGSPLLWVQDLGPAGNARTACAYPGRRLFVLRHGAGDAAVLEPSSLKPSC